MSLIPAGKTVVIPAGTTLYRTADDICSYNPKTICNRKAECSNTGKVGIYFSTYILQALAMSAEYNRDLQLGIFKTTHPITVREGKYSYRNIHGISPPFSRRELLPNEHIGHFNHSMQPIIEYYENYDNAHIFRHYANIPNLEPEKDGELFITKITDLLKINLIHTYSVNKDKLMKLFKSMNWKPPINSPIYLDSTQNLGAVIPLVCPQNNRRHRTSLNERKRSISLKRSKSLNIERNRRTIKNRSIQSL
jgi:hypothetical protein